MKHDHSFFNGKFFHKQHKYKMKHVWLLLTQMMNILFGKGPFFHRRHCRVPFLFKLMQCGALWSVGTESFVRRMMILSIPFYF